MSSDQMDTEEEQNEDMKSAPDKGSANIERPLRLNETNSNKKDTDSFCVNGLAMSDYYSWDNAYRGNALIVNNIKFTDKISWLSERKGAEVDGLNLKKCLEDLDFSVTLKINQTDAEMKELLKSELQKDCSSDDAFVCALLTHGSKNGVYSSDGIEIPVDDITAMFKSKNTLLGKPKIFIFQACRGGKLMETVEADGPLAQECGQVIQRIFAVEADFLYAYSTPPEYYSWRNTKDGSWYIQELVSCLATFGSHMDLCDILTKVNRALIEKHQSKSKGDEFNKRRQVAMYTSTLTRKVVFKKK